MMEQMQAGKTKRPRPRAKAWGDEGGGPKGTAPERHVPTLHQWPPPEPTLGPGRGAQLASPGQRALPAPCDSELWARSRLFGHGESGTRVDPSVPPFPARAVSPRGRLLGSGWRRRVAERPGRGLWVGGAGQGWAGLGWAGPREGESWRTRNARLPRGDRDAAFSTVEGLGHCWDPPPSGPPVSVTLFGSSEPGKPPREGVVKKKKGYV